MANQKLLIDIIANDKTKRALGGVHKSLGRLKNSVFNLRNAFLGLGAGLVARNLVKTGQDVENLRVRLKFLLKNTEEGTKAFDNMAKFASKVPFSLEEISQGSGILATVTDNAEDLQNMLEITGNVAAVTGLDFRTASEQIQRSFSAGIGAADLFREKGVRNMLGFKAGATVSIEETVEAFEKVFGKDGRFGKSTDELAQTFQGTLSMIGDKIFNFKKVLLEAGFFEELKNQFGSLDKFLADNAKELDQIATTVGKNLAQGMVKVVKIGKDLIPTLQNIGKILKSIGDGFLALPPFIQQSGIIGAFLFGKKGLVALASVSLFVDKVQDLIKESKVRMGLFDTDNLKEVNLAVDTISNQISELELQKSLLGDIDTPNIDKRLNNAMAELQILKERQKILQHSANIRKFEAFEHQRELHKGLETNKELLDISQIEESIAKAKAKELKLQNFLLEEANKKRMKFHELESKGVNKFKEQNTLLEEVQQKFKEQNESFSLSNEILGFLNNGIDSFSKGLAESLLLGKSIKETFSNMARALAVEVLSQLISVIAKKGVELAMEKLITKEKQKQVALSKASMFSGGLSGGLGFIGGLLGFSKGGAVSKGQPIVVGERGPEMFIPNSTGQITQSARGTSGGNGTTNINFNISATDVRGIKELLIDNRATIVNAVNSALNEKGKEALV